MRIKIAQASTIILHDGEVVGPEAIVDVEEALGEALCAGGSATPLIEYRPEALTQ